LFLGDLFGREKSANSYVLAESFRRHDDSTNFPKKLFLLGILSIQKFLPPDTTFLGSRRAPGNGKAKWPKVIDGCADDLQK
jgi:hypothetical protein